MERWCGGVAVVTGASSGIGRGIAAALVEHGMKVIAMARREDRLQELKNEVEGKKGELIPYKIDITNKDDVQTAFDWIEKDFGGIHVLINNAGIAKASKFSETKIEDLESVYNLNILSLSIMSTGAMQSMLKHEIDGHIINIASIAAQISTPFPGLTPYFASKRAVKGISEGLIGELAEMKSKIKVTTISPGLVLTEIITKSNQKFPNEQPILKVEDVANAAIYALSQPPNVAITELTIQPVGESIYHLSQGARKVCFP
ncbi:farnesol dehydrogenase [Nilaparvata lugens]|uniref:Seminal fluid protein n=1 Tax=Nilaparvata lugens TaxID=108931 RepID=A0A1I9WLM8_NILLU|nr:farnesol dehydrogenase [Nilaparvata lugens]APA34048.1 seminal fluid protein [Nilaparvata lugens]